MTVERREWREGELVFHFYHDRDASEERFSARGRYEMSISVPSKSWHVNTHGNDAAKVEREARETMQIWLKLKPASHLYAHLDSFLQRVKESFWCAFFHRRARCYPLTYHAWHCGRCFPCGVPMDILTGTPIKDAFGRWYIYPMEDSAKS